MLTLIFGTGPLAGRRLEVGSGLVLGREQADVVIDDPGVSRRHAAIRPVEEGLEIEDLDSLNGTWVNGRRIAGATRLAPGDRVTLGDSSLEVELEVAPREPRVLPAVATPTPPQAAEPLGAFAPPAMPRRRRVATRRLTPTVLSFGAVIVTAIALLIYFAGRG
jgi:predicted component of type VI protein secretion system